jgi:hypothetical protein
MTASKNAAAIPDGMTVEETFSVPVASLGGSPLDRLRSHFGTWEGPTPELEEMKEARRELWAGYIEGKDEPSP